jgi:hypothetical protein
MRLYPVKDKPSARSDSLSRLRIGLPIGAAINKGGSILNGQCLGKASDISSAQSQEK